MARKGGSNPPVRKSVLVAGGVLVVVSLLGLLLMNVVGGGNNGQLPTTSSAPGTVQAPQSKPGGSAPAPAKLREGGRDPFHAVVGMAATQQAPAKVAAAPVATPTPALVTEGSRYIALVKAGKCEALPAGHAYTLAQVIAHQNECVAANS